MSNPNFLNDSEAERRKKQASLTPAERFFILMRLIRIDRMLRSAKITHIKKQGVDVFDEEILHFWRLLHEEKVSYILVGGFATNLHGFSRTTQDMDIWLKDTADNRKRLRSVLEKLGLGDMRVIETTQLIPGFTGVKLPSGFVVDIMISLKGFGPERFEECYTIAPIADILGVPVRFLHYNQLIEAKKASGRPRDLLDIEELEKLRKE